MSWDKKQSTIGANEKGAYRADVVLKKDNLGNTTDILYGRKGDFKEGKHGHVGFDPSESPFGKSYHSVENRDK